MEIKKEFEDETNHVWLLFWSTMKLTTYMVVSDCSASDFKTVITKLVHKHYPAISAFFLTNNEMRWFLRD